MNVMDSADSTKTNNHGNSEHQSIPLRASCDRCRAHKLRCVPSTTSDAKAPCQRCLKAAIPNACIFGRTGRYRKTSVDNSPITSTVSNTNSPPNTHNNNNSRPGTREKQTPSAARGSTPVFPGMRTFALPNASSNSSHVKSYKEGMISTSSDHAHSIYNHEEQGSLYTNPNPNPTTNTIDDVLDMFPASWERDGTINPHLQQLSEYTQQTDVFMFGNPLLSESEENNNQPHHRSGSNSRMDPSLMSMPPTPQSGFAVDYLNQAMNIDSSKPNGGGPLNELAVLLAEMPLYEDRLSRHAHGNILTYPIGDAIFLTLRFRAILSGRNELIASTEESMPAMLLTLSCYMTLVTIYLTIFNYFASNLSMILAGSDARISKSGHSCTADRFRGLRLDQLQPICLCAGWNPMKKAVLMLLCSLSCTEEMLGLPLDARVTVKLPDEFRGAHEVWFEVGEDRGIVFDEGLMAALMNSGLYKDSRRKTMELREKVKEVEGLVVGVSEMYAVSP